MTFKDQIAKDNQYVFANKDEFWEYHIVNGKKMLCQVDNNELIDRERDTSTGEVFMQTECI